MQTPEPTPQEALELLKQFIAHPGIRCFNLPEFEMAKKAIAVLERATRNDRALHRD
jgi:hypothetical protein